MTVITSSNSVDTNGATAYVLGASENILVAADGYLLSYGATGSGLYLNASADGRRVMIDGRVHGAYFGVEVLGDDNVIEVRGVVTGDLTAITLAGDGNALTVGAQGYVQGLTMGGEGGRLLNLGLVSDLGDEAIQLSGSHNRVVNHGLITSDFSALFLSTALDCSVVNNGVIEGGVDVHFSNDSLRFSVTNNGEWYGGMRFTIDADVLINSGVVDGVVLLNDGADIVSNTGRMDGAVLLGGGADYYIGRNGVLASGIAGDAGADTMTGGLLGELMTGDAGDDQVTGLGSDDTLRGVDGNDLLRAGLADDTLDGGVGLDTLSGGKGDDRLTGGANGDTFSFERGFGQDVITDFKTTTGNRDFIRFDGGIFADFAAVQARMTQIGDDVLIVYNAANTILIENVTVASLTAVNFDFVT